MPGGGLSLDGDKWIKAPRGYFLPLKVLSKVFRGKYLSYLEAVRSQLKFDAKSTDLLDAASFKKVLVAAASKEWVVYAKAPFAGPERVLEYLGNYTHRIAISNYRIEAIEDGYVSFRYKDRKDGNQPKLLRISVHEFTRRFLSHVLPTKFVRIRHFGFLGSRQKQKNIETARLCLGVKERVEVIKGEDYKQLLKRLLGNDVTLCPCCKQGKLVEVGEILPHWKIEVRRDTS